LLLLADLVEDGDEAVADVADPGVRFISPLPAFSRTSLAPGESAPGDIELSPTYSL